MAKTKPQEDEIVVEASPLSAEDKRLNELFDKMESASLDTLENAARQIITLSTTLLGAFFGLLALKDAPEYLSLVEVKVVGSLALTAFFAALIFALRAVSPKRYDFPRASLTAKRKAFEDMLNRKHDSVRYASWTFAFGALMMLSAAVYVLTRK